jgi:hypothetical protein
MKLKMKAKRYVLNVAGCNRLSPSGCGITYRG